MKRPLITYHHAYKTILFVLICLFSCRSNKLPVSEPMITERNPKLLFLNYTISKDNNNLKRISLINKIEVNGKLKQNTFLREGSQGDLNFNLLDKKGNTIDSFIIKNPLFKTIEYVDESKHFKVKQLDLDSTQFSLRLQLNPKVISISISEIDTLKKASKPLIKTKLN